MTSGIHVNDYLTEQTPPKIFYKGKFLFCFKNQQGRHAYIIFTLNLKAYGQCKSFIQQFAENLTNENLASVVTFKENGGWILFRFLHVELFLRSDSNSTYPGILSSYF